jgi:methylated-DNA-[protein]-cysteine S-methyltransferase
MTLRIPMGKVTTYGAIAKAIGFPGAARAVGQALGANPNPIVVPCHRVVRSDGVLGGYSGGEGPRTKAKLLAREGVRVTAGRVNLDKFLFSDFP